MGVTLWVFVNKTCERPYDAFDQRHERVLTQIQHRDSIDNLHKQREPGKAITERSMWSMSQETFYPHYDGSSLQPTSGSVESNFLPAP